MKKKKKQLSRADRIDKYLYKNSYLYKWGKLLLKKRAGQIVIILMLVAALSYFGFGYYKNNQVKSFLEQWQTFQNNNQYPEFMKCVDISDSNPYKDTFPLWKEQFFTGDLKLVLKDISVKKTGAGIYQARALVVFMCREVIENQFTGLIFVKEDRAFKIIRVEI